MQKALVMKILIVSFIMLLVACSSDQHYNSQINGNEEYLKAPALHNLNSPPGITLPTKNDEYDIPSPLHNGAIGKKLDIRPPTQPLALLNIS